MQELGAELKQLRESKGLSLEDVQVATKIRTRYLEAIEAGDLNNLPGMVYARGFIRSYAEYLGINGQELLERHSLAATPDVQPVDLPRKSKPVKVAKKSGFSLGSARVLPQVLAGVGVIAVCALVYSLLVTKGEDKPVGKEPVKAQEMPQAVAQPVQKQQAKTQPQPNVPAQPKAQQTPPPKPATVVTQAQKTNVQTVYNVAGATNLNLQLAAQQDCWVQVTADGKVIESGIVKAGASRAWKANKTLSVMTGKSKFITMMLNDQAVDFEKLLRGYTYLFQLKA